MPDRHCSVKDCRKPVGNRGMCPMHYARVRRHGSVTFTHRPRTEKERIERFWRLVDKRGPSDCWPWLGTHSSGYGYYNRTRAHLMILDILGLPKPGVGFEADHICRNRDCVNPRHIRSATSAQQKWNTKLHSTNTSGFRGVSRDGTRWVWGIKANGKRYRKGGYLTPEAAHAARMKVAKKVHGAFMGEQVARREEGDGR